MGGTIAVTVRTNKQIQDAGYDEEYRMLRWTNTLPHVFSQLGVIDDLKVFEDYMESWFLMRDDYERNKDKGEFENFMTDAYFPTVGMVPEGYGLVVIDFKDRVIRSMQGYTDPQSVNWISMMLSNYGKNYTFDEMVAEQVAAPGDDEDEVKAHIKAMIDAGAMWVKTLSNYDEVMADRYVKPEYAYGRVTDTNDLVLLQNSGKVRFPHIQIMIDHPGWTVRNYKEWDAEALMEYKQDLINSGFVLSSEEDQVWNDRRDEILEEQDEVLAHET